MNKPLNIFIGLVLLVVFLVASGALYTIDETQQAVITQFGRLIGQPKKDAGLYFKFPWQTANFFEKRILQWDGDANQIPTLEKRFIWVDTTARWKISDPLKFMQSVRTEVSAQTRLDDIIDASTRDVISRHTLIEVIRNSNRIAEIGNETQAGGFEAVTIEPINVGRDQLSKMILERAGGAVRDYGIELVDVKIKRINYVEEVRRKVYERMISERKRAAEQFRSEGQGKRAEIEGQMKKELAEIQSEAYKQAQQIKGVADAKAIKVYADAYNKDPDFYSFIKTLETYKKTINDDTTLMFSTENEFYNQLKGSQQRKSFP